MESCFITFAIIEIMAGLEEMSGHEVFETRRRIFHFRPVPEVELGLFLDRPEGFTDVGMNPEMVIERLENIQPARHGPMADLELLTEGIHREERTYPSRQHITQQFHMSQVPDLLDFRDIFANHPLDLLVMPPREEPFFGPEERFGENPKSAQRLA